LTGVTLKRDCKESARSDKAGQGKRDFHRHRSRHHSPSSSVVNSKKNHFAGPGSDEDVSDDSKKRKPRGPSSNQDGSSQSPLRSKRRYVVCMDIASTCCTQYHPANFSFICFLFLFLILIIIYKLPFVSNVPILVY